MFVFKQSEFNKRAELIVYRPNDVFRCATIVDYDSEAWRVGFEDGKKFTAGELTLLIDDVETWRELRRTVPSQA